MICSHQWTALEKRTRMHFHLTAVPPAGTLNPLWMCGTNQITLRCLSVKLQDQINKSQTVDITNPNETLKSQNQTTIKYEIISTTKWLIVIKSVFVLRLLHFGTRHLSPRFSPFLFITGMLTTSFWLKLFACIAFSSEHFSTYDVYLQLFGKPRPDHLWSKCYILNSLSQWFW